MCPRGSRQNTVNVLRFFPTQTFNFVFKDTIKALFPKYNPKKEFWKFFAANMASGGVAGAVASPDAVAPVALPEAAVVAMGEQRVWITLPPRSLVVLELRPTKLA